MFKSENQGPVKTQEKFDIRVIRISPVYVNRKKSWYNSSSALNTAQLLTIWYIPLNEYTLISKSINILSS